LIGIEDDLIFSAFRDWKFQIRKRLIRVQVEGEEVFPSSREDEFPIIVNEEEL
jgi:hypothetical protein